METQPSAKSFLILKVKDFGIGIPDKERANIFKPFFKSSDPVSRQMNFMSHGLGLNICKRIA